MLLPVIPTQPLSTVRPLPVKSQISGGHSVWGHLDILTSQSHCLSRCPGLPTPYPPTPAPTAPGVSSSLGLQARTLNWGGLAGFQRTLFLLVINMILLIMLGGREVMRSGVLMAVGQTWTPTAVTKETSPAVSMRP